MTTPYVILLSVCLALLASNVWTQPSLEGRHSDQERDAIDYLPRNFFIRNSPDEPKRYDVPVVADYKLLNKVLAQLDIARAQERDENFRGVYETIPGSKEINGYPEYTESLPENEQRGLRHLRRAQRHYSICRMERNFIPLNNEEYEYRPAYYEEIKCVKNELEQPVLEGGDGSVCSSLGFSCIQLNKTIHLTRRRYTSGCWESEARVILAGCECMSPDRFGNNMRLLSCTYNIGKNPE